MVLAHFGIDYSHKALEQRALKENMRNKSDILFELRVREKTIYAFARVVVGWESVNLVCVSCRAFYNGENIWRNYSWLAGRHRFSFSRPLLSLHLSHTCLRMHAGTVQLRRIAKKKLKTKNCRCPKLQVLRADWISSVWLGFCRTSVCVWWFRMLLRIICLPRFEIQPLWCSQALFNCDASLQKDWRKPSHI